MELNFQLSYEDGERLFAIKQLQHKDDITGNDFAAELLHRELVRLFPVEPEVDDNGHILNADKYKGDAPNGITNKLLQQITAAYNDEVIQAHRRGELDFVPMPVLLSDMLNIILTKYALQNFPQLIENGE